VTFKFEQTVFLRKGKNGLENLVRISADDVKKGCVFSVYLDGKYISKVYLESMLTAECWIPEIEKEYKASVRLCSAEECACGDVVLKPQKHLEIHLVHLSHHDPGYTDLMSHVFQRHYEWFDRALDDMEKRDFYPETSRYRISIEQFWSVEYYISKAPKEKVQRLIDRIKSGDIELTALYGNLITEQLGHEECYRALYPARSFADKCGIKLSTACHMDIPGLSWGMIRALCDAGIELLVADFPQYYNWGYKGLVSFWDVEKIYGYDGPGAFYWQTPDGKMIMLWNSSDLGLTSLDKQSVEGVADYLKKHNYPYDVVRISAKSASFDNSPYVPVFADAAKKWNKQYEYPKIITSTNKMFKKAFEKDIDRKKITLPVVSGDLPGQDYPVAALSMQQITATSRKVQYKLVAAEKLTALAGDDIKNQEALLKEAWRDLLMADDHAYGFQFPAGSAMRASYWEKGTYAMRAEATADDLFDKALSSFADRIKGENDNLRLIVFNPSGKKVSRGVEAPLREFDNCGTMFFPSNVDPKRLKGYILNKRRRVNPGEDVWKACKFKLVDMETKEEVPYYIDELKWNDGEYYAPERCGLAAGGKRMGFFEYPGGMERILRFSAMDIPAFGYKCYELEPCDESCNTEAITVKKEISNGIYKISTDERGVCSIVDLRTASEIIDAACPHRIGDVLIRTKRDTYAEVMQVKNVECCENEVYSKIDIDAEIDGAYELKISFSMYQNIDKIDVSLHMLKSAKPLQTMFMAFPFKGKGFEYQGMLCGLIPGKSILPGAQSDFLTVADYVAVKESDVIWSSKDSGVVALGNLWDGYISPAHSCVMEHSIHNPLAEAELNRSGWIYSVLTANNFGTNFMCSQVFDGVYKFSFGVMSIKSPTECAFWGESERNPVVTQFTDRSRGQLPVSASLIDTGDLQCLAFKEAEDKSGYIMRLWNHSDTEMPLNIAVNGKMVADIIICDALEREKEEDLSRMIKPDSVATIKVRICDCKK